MKLSSAAALVVMLILSQGCDRVRDVLSERLDGMRTAANSNNFNGPVSELAESDYEAFINQRGCLVVVSFSADWCAPCRQLQPVLERVSAEFGDAVKLGRLNVDHARNVAMRAGVRGIPDVRFFRDGRQVHQFTGAQPEARIRETLQNLTLDDDPQERKPEPLVKRLISPSQSENEKEDGPAIQPMDKDWLPSGIERR